MKALNLNLSKLVSILNDGHYHTGTELGAKLNMSRSAVWKNIKKLMDHDISICAIKGKGYALQEPLILLDKSKIKRFLNNKNYKIDIFESIPSTNTYLYRLSHQKKTLISIAEEQRQGRGRLNRSWYSPFGKNIYLSYKHRFHCDVSHLGGVSLIVSLAVIETLKPFGLLNPLQVKWPNDVLYEGKKISGNLIELQAESNGVSYAIIGIGINVNLLSKNEVNIDQPFTSLREITGTYIDRNEVCAILINHLTDFLARYEMKGLSAFINDWHEIDYLYGKEINVRNLKHTFTGKAMGIDKNGNLKLLLKTGEERAFSSGDTTLLKK